MTTATCTEAGVVVMNEPLPFSRLMELEGHREWWTPEIVEWLEKQERFAVAVAPARPLDWNEGLCQNCRMPVHPTERSASKPEAAIEDRADAERYRWLRAHAIEMGGFEFTVDDEAQEAIDSAIAASGFDAEARSGEKREVGKPESL